MKKHILFVDDEPNVLRGIARILHHQRNEWVLSSARSVDAALELISKVAFDAVISDISMPHKDGFELLRSLQQSEATCDIPVIILTSLSQRVGESTVSMSQGLATEAEDYLDKPVDPQVLLGKVEKLLKKKGGL